MTQKQSDCEFDYVVVGAGSAGCAIAARLSEDPRVTVCLVESGGPDKSVLIHRVLQEKKPCRST